jgi:hypothetical protein
MNEEATKIVNEMKTFLDQQQLIPASKVREWVNAPDREVQGALFDLLFEHSESIEPLPAEEKNNFFLTYLERCLREDVQGQYVEGRYAAGHSVRAWFQRQWIERQVNKHTLEEIRNMLARLCREGNAELADAIITAILEHLFSNPEIAGFFDEWKNDHALSSIYQEALSLSSQEG